MNKFFLLLLIPLIFFCHVSISSETFFIRDVELGLRYASLKENRGVILYQDFQIDPVITFAFYNEYLTFEGDSLSFRKFIYSDQLIFRSRLVANTDQPLFPANANIKKNFPNRKDSYEWSNRLEYYYHSYHHNFLGEIDFEYDKDTITHHGNYFAIEGKLKLFSYKIFEPNMFASIGAGDTQHNNYYFGPDSHHFGLTTFTTGINILAPEVVDRFYTFTDIHYFKVLGNQNQNALYANSKYEGFIFTLTFTTDLK